MAGGEWDVMRCSMKDIFRVNKVVDDDSVHIPINGYACKDPGLMAYRLLKNTGIVVLMPNDGCVAIGTPHNEFIYHFHIGVLPEYRGKIAVSAFKEAAQWVFANTTCKKIVGLEPAIRKDAVRFIRLLGFEREGLLKNACPTGDVVVLGLCA